MYGRTLSHPEHTFEQDEAMVLSMSVFEKLDANQSGFLEPEEMHRALEVMLCTYCSDHSSDGFPLADATHMFQEMITAVDYNCDGLIDPDEWTEFCRIIYETKGREKFFLIAETWAEISQSRATQDMLVPRSALPNLGPTVPVSIRHALPEASLITRPATREQVVERMHRLLQKSHIQTGKLPSLPYAPVTPRSTARMRVPAKTMRHSPRSSSMMCRTAPPMDLPELLAHGPLPGSRAATQSTASGNLRIRNLLPRGSHAIPATAVRFMQQSKLAPKLQARALHLKSVPLPAERPGQSFFSVSQLQSDTPNDQSVGGRWLLSPTASMLSPTASRIATVESGLIGTSSTDFGEMCSRSGPQGTMAQLQEQWNDLHKDCSDSTSQNATVSTIGKNNSSLVREDFPGTDAWDGLQMQSHTKLGESLGAAALSGNEKLRREAAKMNIRQQQASSPRPHELPLATVDVLWSILTCEDGSQPRSFLEVSEFVEIWHNARECGFDLQLQEMIPQDSDSFATELKVMPQEITPGGLLHLIRIIQDDPEIHGDCMRESMASLSSTVNSTKFNELDIDPKESMNVMIFQKLICNISLLMLTDDVYIISAILWAISVFRDSQVNGCFEMTDTLAIMMMNFCGRKSPYDCIGGPIYSSSSTYGSELLDYTRLLEVKFDSSDFDTLCDQCQICDREGECGIPPSKAASLFRTVCNSIHLLWDKKAHLLHHSDAQHPACAGDRQQEVDDLFSMVGITGRTEFSLLMEAIWSGMPEKSRISGMKSPLQMCLTLLKRATSQPV